MNIGAAILNGFILAFAVLNLIVYLKEGSGWSLLFSLFGFFAIGFIFTLRTV